MHWNKLKAGVAGVFLFMVLLLFVAGELTADPVTGDFADKTPQILSGADVDTCDGGPNPPPDEDTGDPDDVDLTGILLGCIVHWLLVR